MKDASSIKILRIDLTDNTFRIDTIPNEIVRKFIGGRGAGSFLLYDSVPAKIDPLDESNRLIFTAGPLSGTGFPYSSKTSLVTKSPLTGIYLYSICSGIFAQEMKKAGFWAMDIKGKAQSPVYIVIKDEKVEFKDADDLWGMEPAAAQLQMIRSSSVKKAATVAIGPAGEKLVRFAALFGGGDSYRCFGRGGAGCVFGSKKLKGIVLSGSGKVPIADRERFKSAQERIVQKLKTDFKKWGNWWRRYETAADLRVTNGQGIIPTRNWQTGQFEGWQGIDKSTTPMGWPEIVRPCGPFCLTPGTRDVLVQDGPYKGAHSDVEWEAIYAFGSQCGVDYMPAILAASQMCDEFGIDNMTAGITIGFAMECFEKGLIGLQETDGIDLRFGDHAAMIAALEKIVSLEGFGKELAKGTKMLSNQINGSKQFAMHAKGIELGGYECRGLNGQALQFAVSTRGGCHHAFGLPARVEINNGTGADIKGKGEQVKNLAISRILNDSLIVCTFAGAMITKDIISDAVSSVFSEQCSIEDLNSAGERIACVERLFNIREGLSRQDDTLPDRLLTEPKPDGPSKGSVVPLDLLKDEFYQAMGYDLKTGNPTDYTIKKLEIEFLLKEKRI